jgi:hypothetical protein
MKIPDHPLFEALRKLDFPVGQYAIFGSAPMWIRGIRESDDLDIIVRGQAWEWARTHGRRTDKKGVDGRDIMTFAGGKIEVHDDWQPGEWDTDALIETAEMIDGIPFVRLESVVEWKKIMGREKDKNDLSLIQEYLLKNPE